MNKTNKQKFIDTDSGCQRERGSGEVDKGKRDQKYGGPLLCSFPPAGAPRWTNPAGHQWTSEPVKVTCTGLPLKQRSSCKRVKSAGERVGNSSYLAQ